ncbi:MAG: O-antigen polymerase [bacterium]
MILKENILLFLLFFGAVLTAVFMYAEIELFVPLILGLFGLVFIVEKIILGDSLRFAYLTLPSFFLFFYIILMSFPSLFLFSEIDSSIRYTYFVAIQSVLVTFPLGVGLANLFSRNPSAIIKNFLFSKLTKTKEDHKFTPLFLMMFFSSAPILLFYYLYAEHIQLIEIIKSYPTSIDPVTLRFAESQLPEILQLLFEMLRRLALPLCVLFAYFTSHFYKAEWKIIFWITFFLTLIISCLTLDRAEPIALMVAMVLAYLLIRGRSIFKIFDAKLIIIVFIAMVMGATISVFQYQSDFTLSRFVGNIGYVFFHRIILGAADMALRAFQHFSDPSLFLHGQSIKILTPLLGLDYIAYYPATFVGDLWRNFGWFGVIIGSIVYGFLFQLIQIKLFIKKSIPVLSIYVILLINVIWPIFGNALGTVSVVIFFLSVLFLWLIKLTYRKILAKA